MITSMKSTHESVPFKHSVVRLYTAAGEKYKDKFISYSRHKQIRNDRTIGITVNSPVRSVC